MSSATISRPVGLGASNPEGSVARILALGPSKRLEEFKAGNLNRAELFVWAARYPEEVPMVNGELPVPR